jgi:serine acetyltransferase
MESTEQPTDPTSGRPSLEPRPASFRSVLSGRDFIFSARRLWLLSVALHRSGRPRLGKLVKNVNSILYHNSLHSEVALSADVQLGHHGIGTVIHPKVVIGRKVKIFQNVTMAVRPPTGDGQIVIDDNAVVGANAVIITPADKDVRIGYGARVGAGAVVTRDVPPRMNAISAPVELRPRRNHRPS